MSRSLRTARVIPAALVDAHGEAVRVLEEAHAEAARIVASARLEAAQIHEDARARGEAAGRAELASTLRGLSALEPELRSAAQRSAVDLALAIVRRLCLGLGEQASARVAALVEEAEAHAPSEVLVIRAHPDDVAALCRRPGLGSHRWRADPSISRGGCVITAGWGTTDGRLELALELLTAALAEPR